jgi:hypothetical protein
MDDRWIKSNSDKKRQAISILLFFSFILTSLTLAADITSTTGTGDDSLIQQSGTEILSSNSTTFSKGSSTNAVEKQLNKAAGIAAVPGDVPQAGRSVNSDNSNHSAFSFNPYDPNDIREFYLERLDKVDAVKLKIIEIQPLPITVNVDFQVTVQSQGKNNRPANVTNDSDILLTRILTGTGSLTGNTR